MQETPQERLISRDSFLARGSLRESSSLQETPCKRLFARDLSGETLCKRLLPCERHRARDSTPETPCQRQLRVRDSLGETSSLHGTPCKTLLPCRYFDSVWGDDMDNEDGSTGSSLSTSSLGGSDSSRDAVLTMGDDTDSTMGISMLSKERAGRVPGMSQVGGRVGPGSQASTGRGCGEGQWDFSFGKGNNSHQGGRWTQGRGQTLSS